MAVESRAVPAVKQNPILGSLRPFAKDRIPFLLRNAADQGPICAFRIGPLRFLQVNDPRLAYEIIEGHAGDLEKGMIIRNIIGPGGAQGLFTSEGEFHDHTRQLLAPSFAPGAFDSLAEEMAANARAAIAAWPATTSLDLRTATTQLGRRVAGAVFFGDPAALSKESELGGILARVQEHLDYTASNPLAPPPQLPTPGNRRMKNDIARFREIVLGMAARRRANPTADMLTVFTSLTTADGKPISDSHLSDEIATALVAHEIIAVALAWTLAAVARDEALHEQLRAAATDAPGALASSHTATIEAVANEGMRLFQPTGAVLRQARRSFEVDGYTVRKRDSVLVVPWVIHRQSSIFTAPDEFQPGRWQDGSAPREPGQGYMPFGIGRRDCIGQHLASLELRIALGEVAKAGTLVADGPLPPPVARFNMEPSRPLVARWTPA